MLTKNNGLHAHHTIPTRDKALREIPDRLRKSLREIPDRFSEALRAIPDRFSKALREIKKKRRARG